MRGRRALPVRTATRVLLAVAVLLALGAGAFLVWASTPLGPMPEAVAALQSGPDVRVETGQWLVFRPAGPAPTAGYILYPGGRVDARSYAPPARAIARAGYLAVIVPMPLNLAVLGADRADGVIAAFPAVRVWAVGGHSLGGAMAARYANRHRTAVRALDLWAAYPAEREDLNASGLRVLSQFGTRDGVAAPAAVVAARPRLPPGADFRAIEGGNHAQFGSYGPQPGDGTATISREAQQAQVVAATVGLLGLLGP